VESASQQVDTDTYVDQEFSDFPTYSSFLADDFTNGSPWTISNIFVPGNGWNGFSSLYNATALTWQIYADCAGVPCGNPSGGGSPPVWTLTLAPGNAQVTITTGFGGYPSNTLLELTAPFGLPAGHWWLVFYPTLSYGSMASMAARRRTRSTATNGQFINPGGAFGYGTSWQCGLCWAQPSRTSPSA